MFDYAPLGAVEEPTMKPMYSDSVSIRPHGYAANTTHAESLFTRDGLVRLWYRDGFSAVTLKHIARLCGGKVVVTLCDDDDCFIVERAG